jgi:hypothetical protein
MTWQSNHEADMFMTVLSFPPSYSSLSAISAYLSAPIHKDSHRDENESGAWRTGVAGVVLHALANLHEGGST